MAPPSPPEIDAAWLGAALGESVEVTDAADVATGVGLLARVVRVHLHDGRRLVVKLPSSDPQTRAIADRFGYYVREAGTYRHLLAATPAMPVPRCVAVADTAEGPAVVLEELADHRSADQLSGASPADAFAAADLLAHLHASFWNSPALAVHPWLPGPADAAVTVYEHLFAMTWEPFCARMAATVPAGDLAAAASAITRFGAVCAAFAGAPRTLVHGDFRLDNLLFTPDGRAVALDWQLAAWGRGAYDLAFFASGSVDPGVLAGIEADLVARYCAGLAAHGVADYPLEACWRDYLGGLVLNLPNPVTALVAVPPGNERGARLLEANAARALATVARHQASLSSW